MDESDSKAASEEVTDQDGKIVPEEVDDGEEEEEVRLIAVPSWGSDVLEKLAVFYSLDFMCDTSLQSEDGHTYNVHSAVLAASSPILQAMLLQKYEERQGGTSLTVNATSPYSVSLEMSSEALEPILKFIYHGTLSVSKDKLPDVMSAAETLNIQALITAEKVAPEATVKEENLLDISGDSGGKDDSRQLLDTDDGELCLDPSRLQSTLNMMKLGMNQTVPDIDAAPFFPGIQVAVPPNLVGDSDTEGFSNADDDDDVALDKEGASSQGEDAPWKTLTSGGKGRNLRCTICKKYFASAAKLQSHMAGHAGGQPFKCRFCPRSFGVKQNLEMHELKHEKTIRAEAEKQNLAKELGLPLMPDLDDEATPRKDCAGPPHGHKDTDDMPPPDDDSLFGDKRKRGRPKSTIKHICRYCNKELRTPSMLRKHERVHTGERPFKCSFCHRGFAQAGSQAAHERICIKNEEAIARRMELDLPDGENEVMDDIAKHELDVRQTRREAELFSIGKTGKKKKKKKKKKNALGSSPLGSYGCPLCGKVYFTTMSLTRHVMMHNGENPFTCTMCSTPCNNSTELKLHMTTHGPDNDIEPLIHKGIRIKVKRAYNKDKSLSCKYCKKTFDTNTDQQNHVWGNPGERPFPCNICGKMLRSCASLHTHMFSHTGIKPVVCGICGKSFANALRFRIHKRIHTDERPYPCKYCEKAFNQVGARNEHERIHTGEKPYSCKTCGKTFRQQTTLTYHERIHTGALPYECKECHKTFRVSSALRYHERVRHTKERPHSCSYCEKTFVDRTSLKMHEKRHTGEKSFTCKQCGKSFYSKSHLNRHERTHSNEKPINYHCKAPTKSYTNKVSEPTPPRPRVAEKAIKNIPGLNMADVHEQDSHSNDLNQAHRMPPPPPMHQDTSRDMSRDMFSNLPGCSPPVPPLPMQQNQPRQQEPVPAHRPQQVDYYRNTDVPETGPLMRPGSVSHHAYPPYQLPATHPQLSATGLWGVDSPSSLMYGLSQMQYLPGSTRPTQ